MNNNGFVIPFSDKLKCSICQDRLKDAQIIPCGHTFCKTCIAANVRANRHSRSLTCPECKKSSQLNGHGNVDSLPRCFVINALLDEINQTFDKSGDSVSIGRHGFQTKEIFQCPICFEPMADGRYLPCGHAYCKGCLDGHPRDFQGHLKCGKCQQVQNLPAGGVGALAITYRINSIVAEMRSGNLLGPEVPPSASSQPNGFARMGNGSRPFSSSSSSHSTTVMEDVEQAKKRAQAEANRIQVFVHKYDGKTITVDTNLTDTVRKLKQQIEAKIRIATSQQTLNYGGSTLQDQRTLQSYGIGNLSTINISARLRGGSAD